MNSSIFTLSAICFSLLSVILVNLVLIPVSTTPITDCIPFLSECGIFSMIAGSVAIVLLKIKAIK